MNRADKAAAEKRLQELQDKAADMYEKRKLKMVGKNHSQLQRLKKQMEKENK